MLSKDVLLPLNGYLYWSNGVVYLDALPEAAKDTHRGESTQP